MRLSLTNICKICDVSVFFSISFMLFNRSKDLLAKFMNGFYENAVKVEHPKLGKHLDLFVLEFYVVSSMARSDAIQKKLKFQSLSAV